MSRAAPADRWAWVVAGLGLVLLLLLFADWYDLGALPSRVYEYPDQGTGAEYRVDFFWSGDLDAWGTVGFTSIAVLLFSVLCVARALVVRGTDRPGLRATWSRIVAAVGILIGVWLAARLIWPPEDVLVPAWGLWASLGVLLAILLANGMGSIARR